MRRYILLSLIGCIISLPNKAQNSNLDTSHQFNIVHLPIYYKAKGIIFSKDYKVGIEMSNEKSRYSPSIEDISKLEEIFSKKYNEAQKSNVNTKYFFRHWVRQYIGLIDYNGNKNIIVQLINNTKPHKVCRLLGKKWEEIFVIILADSFYAISTRFRINIDTEEVTTEL
jgi:hypothetical protein